MLTEDVDCSVAAVCQGGGQVDAGGGRRHRVGRHNALVAEERPFSQGEAASGRRNTGFRKIDGLCRYMFLTTYVLDKRNVY